MLARAVVTILATLWKTLGLGGSVAVGLGIALTVCWFGWDRAALQRDVAEAALDKVAVAAVQAEKDAREAKERAEREYRDLAERTDNATIERLETELGRAERFIAANRVCPPNRSAPGRPAPPAGDNGTGSPDGPGEAPELDGVIVPADDVRICTENTVRLESARTWALELTD